MRPLTILTALSLLTASSLLGCKGGDDGGGSTQAVPAPTPKPTSPQDAAAATKRYSQDVGPNTGP